VDLQGIVPPNLQVVVLVVKRDKPAMPAFTKKVFINCPYDDEYRNTMLVLIFLVTKFGYVPSIAAENTESSDRMMKITKLISESSIGIHDISRMEHSDKTPLARFNMPFELGLDYGHKHYCCEEKKLLILQEKAFLSKKTLSDLSGIDIEAHNGKVEEVIKVVRDFFCSVFSLTGVNSSSKLWTEYYTEFNTWLRDKAIGLGFSQEKYLNELTLSEYIKYSHEYVTTVGTHY
jgi:hypothetical protein